MKPSVPILGVPSAEFLSSGESNKSLLVMPGTPEADVIVRAAALSAGDQYDRASLTGDQASQQAARKSEKDLRQMAEALRPTDKTAKNYNSYEPVVIRGEKLEHVIGGLALVMGTGHETTQRAKELWDKTQGDAQKRRLERLKAEDRAAEASSHYDAPHIDFESED